MEQLIRPLTGSIIPTVQRVLGNYLYIYNIREANNLSDVIPTLAETTQYR